MYMYAFLEQLKTFSAAISYIVYGITHFSSILIRGKYTITSDKLLTGTEGWWLAPIATGLTDNGPLDAGDLP